MLGWPLWKEGGREWKETAMGKENNRDGELVVNHVIRRKEALIRLFDLHTCSFLLSSSASTRELSNERLSSI